MPRIHLYCLCWNERAIVPFFLRHYAGLVDAFFILDNGSTDGTLALLHGDPRVSIGHFTTRGDSFVVEEHHLSEAMWQNSRDSADWVIVVDMDEFLHHRDFGGYLAQCRAQGVTAIGTRGYDMVADDFPPPTSRLDHSVIHGTPSSLYDKPCIFDPGAITRTNFSPGRHTASPEGRVVWPAQTEVALLHYKYIGLDYLIRRSRMLATGLRAQDHAQKWGAQYLRSDAEIAADHRWRLRQARPVPGLAAGAQISQPHQPKAAAHG